MLQCLFGQDERVARFVAQQIPHLPRQREFRGCRAIGVAQDGELIAGVVYHNWNPVAGTIEMSGAALPRRLWVTRTTLAVLFGYPFQVCGCQQAEMWVRADNAKLLRQLAVAGCTLIPVPRKFGNYADGVLCLLTREAWAVNKIYRSTELTAMERAA